MEIKFSVAKVVSKYEPEIERLLKYENKPIIYNFVVYESIIILMNVSDLFTQAIVHTPQP